MIYLSPGEKITGVAGAVTTITATIYGRRALRSVSAKLDQRQVPSSNTDLFVATGEEVIVDEIHLANPTGTGTTIKLWHSGTTDAFIILPAVELGPGEYAVYNSEGWHFYTASGILKVTATSLAAGTNVKINVARSSSAVSFSNTTAEQTLASYTIPANEPAAGDVYKLRASGTLLNNTGASVNYTFRLKYGATTMLATTTAGHSTSAIRRRWTMEGYMLFETTSAEEAWGEWRGTATGWGDTWSFLGTSESMNGQGNAAETSTTGKAFALTAQMGTASVNADIFCEAYIFERLAV